ncbi:hypothetical protein KC19_VG026500 [Ceratodon purpureus]|uniref:Uncharacterized protein n=1 Tax=Ceratodon purpureus TaxID=3225 RepID=A0A8T0HLB0_CERPU|nr:hypothetical protein KC19_VG026500 [Ceratodon purpureus]
MLLIFVSRHCTVPHSDLLYIIRLSKGNSRAVLNSDLDARVILWIRITGMTVGALALLFAGTAFIVMCYILFKDLRAFPFKLIFYLSLSDMLGSLFNMLGYVCLPLFDELGFFSISNNASCESVRCYA